jgi:hypothetical protein
MDTTQYDNHSAAGGIIGGIIAFIFILIYLAFIAAALAGMWKTFVKMGHPGWAGIVPYYNFFLIVEAIGKPIMWFILLLIPCTAIVFYPMILIEFAKRFDRGIGFALGLIFLPFIFWPILGFGSAKYLGPVPQALAA